MKRRVAGPMSVVVIMFMVVVDVLATCGGGGGGGTGGMGGGAMGSEVVDQYDAVRSKEMMEARVDAVFASIVKDPAFITLTAGADGKLPMPRNR